MVFTSRRRTAPHLTPPTGQLPRAVGTKLGERCQHKFHCWFRHQCRGWHSELEQQHFADCEASATKLEAPYCAAGVCIRDGCNGAHNVEQECTEAQQEDVFYDTVLAPRRRRHRRLRKKQRARMRRNNRVELKVFRRVQRDVGVSDRTRTVMIQTQSELYCRAKGTQTQHSTVGSSTTSTGGKEEIVQADAIVQTNPVHDYCIDMASQCDGPTGSAGEMAESEEMREMLTRLDVTKGECDDLQYQLRQVQEECKNLQWLLEHERHERHGGPDNHTAAAPPPSRENLYAGYDHYSSDEEEKYCDY